MKCLKCKKDIIGMICVECDTEQEQYLFDNLDNLELNEVLNHIFQSGQFKMDAKILNSVLRDLLINYPQQLNVYQSILGEQLISNIENLKSDEEAQEFIYSKTQYYAKNYGLSEEVIYNSLKILIESIKPNIYLIDEIPKTLDINESMKNHKLLLIVSVVFFSILTISIGIGSWIMASQEQNDIIDEKQVEVNETQEPHEIIEPSYIQDVGFTKSVITDAANDIKSIYAADIDNDGDMDVVSASYEDDSIAWHENIGLVFTEHIITNINDPVSVSVADIDNDGDMDVVCASERDSEITWYENNDQIFTEHLISNKDDRANSVYVVDIDNDGDMDVVSAGGGSITWYENNNPGFIKEHIIDDVPFYSKSVFAVDIDNDKDMDLLSADKELDLITLYENDNQIFTRYIITDTADGAYSVHAADIDNDGDMDVLSASIWDDTLAWYENVNQTFTKKIITNTALGANSVYAVDMDNDGDLDVLSSSIWGEKNSWYENDKQVFTLHIITNSSEGASLVYAVDLNKDGNMDIISADQNDNTIAWYGILD
ncbi:VCBS repeat-containing protein [Mycoplasmatota bacterium WC44]